MGLEQSLDELLMEPRTKWSHLYVQAKQIESNVIPTQLQKFEELSQYLQHTVLCIYSLPV